MELLLCIATIPLALLEVLEALLHAEEDDVVFGH